MSSSECLATILTPEISKALFGDKEAPSAKLLAEIDEHIQGLMKNYPADFQKKMNQYYGALRLKHDQDVMDSALTARAVSAGVNRVSSPGFKGKEFKAIQSFFGSPGGVLGQGMDVNVKGYTGHYLSEWESLFMGQLQKEKLLDLVETASPEFDLEVKKAKWNLSEGSKRFQVSEEADRVAQIHWDLTKKMLNDQREQGIALGNYKNYIHPQSPDPKKFLALGNDIKTRVLAFHNFLKGVDFDREAFFGPKNVGNLKEELNAVKEYLQDILKGEVGEGASIPTKDIGDVIYAVPNGVNVGNKLAYSRKLRFNDPISQHKFDVELGDGNLFENTLEMVAGKAKLLALVKMFGSNPEEGFLKIVDKAHKALEAAGSPEARKLKVGGEPTPDVMKMIKNAMGSDSIPVSQMLAKATERVSNLVDTSKLGGVGISSIPSFALGAAVIRDRTGRNFLSSQMDLMTSWLKQIPPGERDANLRRFGMVAQVFTDKLNKSMSEGFVDNSLRRMGRLQSSVSGLRLINNGIKATVGEILARDIGENLTSGKMSPNIQATLLRSGFQPEDFPFLKLAVESADDVTMLTKEGFESLKNAPGFKERAKLKGYSPSQYISHMQANFGSMILTASDFASSTAGTLESISWFFGHGGTKAGTAAGSIMRLRSKYSSFMGSIMRQMSQSAYAKPDLKLLEAGELRSKGFQFWGPAATTLALTSLGYLTLAAQDMLKGKNPKDPEKLDTWKDALIQGGAGGVYAQYILTEFDKFGRGKGTATALAGPVFGDALPLFDMVRRVVIGDEKLTPTNKRKVSQYVRQNLPLQNLIGWKHFVDKMHYDIIDEYLDPGSSAARERNINNLERGTRLDSPF